MAKARCPGKSGPEHHVKIPDDRLEVGLRGKCSRYGHDWEVAQVDPLRLRLAK